MNKQETEHRRNARGLNINLVLLTLGLAFALITETVYSQPYSYQSADRNLVTTSKETRILPVSYLREYDPITVFFNRDVFKKGAGPLDSAKEYVKIVPSHPGEYRVLDTRTVEFRPTVPWEPLKKYRISSDKTTKELFTLLSVPSAVYPSSGSTDLDPIKRIGLEFRGKVDIGILSKLVSFETCPLPGIDRKGCNALKSNDYRIKESSESAQSYKYWFIFNEPLGYGKKIRMHLKLAENPEASEALKIYSFDTKSDFTIERAGTYDQIYSMSPGIGYEPRQALRINQDGSIVVDFSAVPADPGLSVVKSLVSFSPSPSKMEYRFEGRRLIIKIGVDPEALYKVTLTPVNMKDNAGRALVFKKSCSFYAYQPKDRSFAKWDRGFGIVERYGPQHFPISVKGISSLDFRVYKISPLHNAFSHFSRVPVTVSEINRPPGPGEEPVSSEEITRTLSAHEIATHIQMLGSPQKSLVIDCGKQGIIKFQSIDLKPILTSVSGQDRPGTYLVGYRTLDGSGERSYIRVDVTDLCLSTVESKLGVLFGVTSFSTGKPVGDASVKIEGVLDGKVQTLAQGKTGVDGVFQLRSSDVSGKDGRADVRRIVVTKGEDYLVLDTRGPGSPLVYSDNHWKGSGADWLKWLTYQDYDENRDRNFRAFIRTERPIYRPEDSVHVKGYVRDTYHGKIQDPLNDISYTLRVLSPSGNQMDYPVELSDLGSFDLSFKEDNSPTGTFSMSLIRYSDHEGEREIANTDYQVEAYRIPRFEVRLNGDEKIPNDRPADVELTASYYAGGRVVEQEVTWKITSFPFSFRPEGLQGFILSSDSRYGAVNEDGSQSVQEETGITNENGLAKVTINPQSSTAGNPRKYMIEATVTDADQQTVSARHSVIALPPFVLGLKTERHVTSGSTISADVVAIGVNEKFIKGQKVNIQLKKMNWISYLVESDFSRGRPKYITDENVELISEKSITTSEKPVKVEFTDQQPGVYILELSSRDRLGRLQKVKADLFLAGNKPQAWRKAENYVFETVPDKAAYEPGQTAKVLLKSPYQKAMALAVVEMPDGTPKYKWVEVSDGQATFSVSIDPDMVPRVPVSFLLMRPRISPPQRTPDGVQVDAGKPETVASTTWLTVKPVYNSIEVKLDHPQTVLPDGEFEMTISLRDNQGKPRSGEVALWLVDEAVLSLRKEKSLDPLEAFIEQVSSHISMRDSRNLVLGDLRIPENPGGDEGEEIGDAFGKITVRKNFKTVPYWNPSIKVDKSGNASVKIKVSSDLTNFAIRAMAVSGIDRFGAAKGKISVRLPVIVQPALPRFVRLGDKIRAGGVARVVEGPGGSAQVSVDAKGLLIIGSGTQQVQLDKAKPLPLFSEMVVETPTFDSHGRMEWDSVTFKMKVIRKSDKAGDAFEVKIPVLPDRPYIEETVYGEVDSKKGFTWKAFPEKARKNTVFCNLLISDQLQILKAVSALTYLVKYPHGCTEQRVSQSYPSLLYKDLWARFGIDSPDPSLKSSVMRTLEYLGRTQHENGLFSYWPKSAPYVYLTAYVVEFLTEVDRANREQKAGYPLDQSMYNNAIEALKRSLRSDYGNYVDGYSYYERSCALLSLSKAGHLDIGYARELAGRAREVDIQSKAKVFKAVSQKKDVLGSEYLALEKALWESTIFKIEQGKEAFAGLQQRDMRLGARVHSGEITALASLVNSLSSVNNSKPKFKMMVDELVRVGDKNGDWGNTYANSMALLALRETVGQSAAPKAVFKINEGGNVSQLKTGQKGTAICNWRTGSEGGVQLTDQSKAVFWGRLSRRYMPEAPGSSAQPVQRGFVVKRELIKIKKDAAPEKIALEKGGRVITLSSGEIIEEHVQVMNPETRLFAAVSIPIAAGFEPLNPNLENASSDAKPLNSSSSEGDYSAYLDDQVIYYFESMAAGTYDFYFRTRAITEGEYSHPPARAEMMYQMGVFGSSAGARIVIDQ